MRPDHEEDHEAVGVESTMMGPLWGRQEVASVTRAPG